MFIRYFRQSMSELKQVVAVLVLFKKFTSDKIATEVTGPGQKVCHIMYLLLLTCLIT